MALPLLPREWKDRDPPPAWDGEQPTQRWRSTRRAVVLWSEDTDVPKPKQGIRFYRQLSGKAAVLAEALPDESLRGEKSLQTILEFFDRLYDGHMRIAKEIDFETAVYGGARNPSQENFLQYVLRKKLELFRYEQQQDVTDSLGDHTKGKILMKFSRMDSSQISRVQTWLKGDRSYARVEEALIRLDTDVDPAAAAAASKAFWLDTPEEEQWDDSSAYYDEYWPAEEYQPYEDDEDFLGEEYDQGEDSETEGIFWVSPTLLQASLEEPQLEDTFATFAQIAQVKQQKNQYRLNRGFYNMDKGKSKGKGKGKRNYTGYPSSFSSSLSSKGYSKDGKGNEGGKAGGKSDKHAFAPDWQDHLHRRWDCDQRRNAKNFCGGIGHIAARCIAPSSSSAPGASHVGTKQFFVGDLSSSDAATFEFGFVDSDQSRSWLCLITWPTWSHECNMDQPMGIIDTGAINAVCGGPAYLQLDEALRARGLGALAAPPPKKLGGVGGSCDILAAAEIPISFGRHSGLVSTAICAGDIPFLIPLPLLASLKALVDTAACRQAKS
eukprot:5422302-Amphidinium_carterae.2